MTFERAKALLAKGISRPTLFFVSIPNNDQTSNFTTEANGYLRFFCQSTRMPELAHETVGRAGQGRTGVISQQPTMVTFGKPFSITVIENSDFLIYKNMQQWFNNSSPTYNTLGNASQRMGYYNTFTTDITLKKMELPLEGWDSRKLNDAIRKGVNNFEGYRKPVVITFKNAYPTMIGDINLATDNFNSMTTFEVSFNYESYHVLYDEKNDD